MKRSIVSILKRLWFFFKSDKKVILAFFLSVILFLFIQIKFFPYTLSISKIDNGRKSLILYHDFDHDGNSERIEFEYNFRTNNYDIYIYDSNGKKRFETSIARTGIMRYMNSFINLDNDSLDEFVFFNISEMKLNMFIYSFTKNNIINVVPIYEFKSKELNKNLFLFKILYFLDLDNDGIKEIVFWLRGMDNSYSSQIFVYNIRKRKIVNQSPIFHRVFNKIQVFDVDSDDKYEYILYPGLMKLRVNSPEPSKIGWIQIIDDDLKTKILQKKYDSKLYSVDVQPLLMQNKTALLVKGKKGKQFSDETFVQFVNMNGQIAYFKQFNEGKISNPVFIYDSNNTFSRVLIKQEMPTFSRFILYDSTFTQAVKELIIQDINFERLNNFYHPFYRKRFHVMANSKTILFLDDELQILAKGSIEAPFRFFNSTLGYEKGTLYYGLNTLDYFYKIAVLNNYIFQYRFLFIFIFWAFLYGLFRVSSSLYQEVWSSYIIKNTSIKKSPRGIMLINQTGYLIFLNENIRLFFNLSIEQDKNIHYKELFKNYTPIVEFIGEILKNKVSRSQEITFLQGTYLFNGQIVGIPLKKRPFLSRFYYFEVEDYSQPLQSDRLKVWSEAVHKMVHDIKTPLSTIGINLQLLKYKLKDLKGSNIEDVEKKFDIIEKELKRVRSITRDFLKFTNLSTPNLESVNLNSIVHKVLKRLLPIYNHDINFEFYPEWDPVQVKVDPRMIEMVFDILIENAIQALEGKGKISIYYTRNYKTNSIVVHVEDNGKGIDKHELNKIFEPFYTTKEEGTGLGLVYAQKIIKDHGSELKVKSELNEGTTFYFEVPLI